MPPGLFRLGGTARRAACEGTATLELDGRVISAEIAPPVPPPNDCSTQSKPDWPATYQDDLYAVERFDELEWKSAENMLSEIFTAALFPK